MCRKQNFEIDSSLDFYFLLSLLPSFFAFLASFFSLAGHLVDFILVGRAFRKAFRILGLLGEKEKKTAEPRIEPGPSALEVSS